jgi:hypothetical protein
MHASCCDISVMMCLAACVSIATPLCHLSPHLPSCHALVLRFICLCLCTCLFVHLSYPPLSSIPTSIFLSCTRPAVICLFLCNCLLVYLSHPPPLFVIYLHTYLLVMHSSCGSFVFVCVLACLCIYRTPLFFIYLHIYLLVMHLSCGHMSLSVCVSIAPPLCHLSPRLSSCHALVLRSYVCVSVLVCLCIYRTPSFSSISTSIFLSCTRPVVICLCLCTCLFVYLSHPLFVIYLHIYLLVMHSSCGSYAHVCVLVNLCIYRTPLCHLSPHLSSCHALVLRSYVCVCVLVYLCIYRTLSLSSISTSIFLSCTRPAVVCLCLCTCLFVYLSQPLFVSYISPHLSSCHALVLRSYVCVCVLV